MKSIIGDKPTKQQIQALMRCKLPENATLLELLTSRLEETKQSLIKAEDMPRIHRLQGRAEILQDFLEAVEKSQEVMGRISK